MRPIEYYQRLIESNEILRDEQQAFVIDRLQLIYDQLTDQKSSLFGKLSSKKGSPQGLYLWGEVGIGKTFLVDCFFYCLPFKNKLRIHFHKFMKMIQEQLKTLQGQVNPLTKIAKKLAKETCVICFDELIVNDIADAMLLEGLFEALYKEKICLIFTSNTAPDHLYWKGLQRESFLPAIELMKKNSEVINVLSHTDYRFRNYDSNRFYYWPLNQEAENYLEGQFAQISKESPIDQRPLRINDREIHIRKKAKGVVWFDFLDICGIPRSQNDFLAIAQRFDSVIISNVVAIAPEQNDLARSFINLIDVFYDAKTKVIISAETPIEDLYRCGRMLFEFARTRSRLIEMQTLAWHTTPANLR